MERKEKGGKKKDQNGKALDKKSMGKRGAFWVLLRTVVHLEKQ